MLDRFVIFRCEHCGAYALAPGDVVHHDDRCPSDYTTLSRLTVIPVRAEHVDAPPGHPLEPQPTSFHVGPNWLGGVAFHRAGRGFAGEMRSPRDRILS